MTHLLRRRSAASSRHSGEGGDGGILGRASKPVATIAALALAIGTFSGAALTLGAQPAQAEQSTGASLGSSEPFFVYLRAGETLVVDLGSPAQLNGVLDQNGDPATGAGGVYGPATSDGIWQVSVGDAENNATRTQWEITARSADGNDVPGRVWSELYAIAQAGGGDLTLGQEDLNFWAVNDTGYIYQLELNDYNGVYSNIRADSIGNVPSSGSCDPLYASKASTYDGDNEWSAIPDCGGTYRIFFDEPAADLPAQAQLGDEMVYVKPAPLQLEDVRVDNFDFSQSQRGSIAGTFQWELGERFSGAYWLEIDVDGDGEYDSAVDRRVRLHSDQGTNPETGKTEYTFDGLDGQGNEIQACFPLNSRIYFDRLGEIHFVQEDVEKRGGLSVTRVNGPSSPDTTLYWDDTLIDEASHGSVTPVIDGREGTDSTGGVHGWEGTGGNTWGNNTLIEDWTYYPAKLTGAETTIGTDGCLSIEKTSDATEGTRVGDIVTYTVTVTNTGEFDHTEEFPATVTDDLAEVLDDADFNNDATSSRPGEISYTEPNLTWTGPLAAGDSVDLTYTVKLKTGGDRTVRNVACIPSSFADDTDNCAETESLLPAFRIDKVADTTELPEDGGTVTYTVTVTNDGPGITTAEKPGSITDDLSDVLDDGEFVEGSIQSSTGTATRNGNELEWQGALGVGEQATVTYQVTYDANKGGTHQLKNVACLPVELAGDPTNPCSTVSVPAAALTQWKTSDPKSGTSLDTLDEVTYTLHFKNTGTATATVDNSDDLTKVLDDADVISGPIVSNEALTATQDNGKILITGSVPAGEEYTVSYTVRAKVFSEQGDHVLENKLEKCVASEETPCVTVHKVRSLEVEKTSDVQAVQMGDVVTYTVRVTNIGEGDYTAEEPATASDDLSDVIDDATFNDDASATVGGVTVDGTKLNWSGPLKAGETAEFTYSVTVTSAGDNTLKNTVCAPRPGEDDDCATTEELLPEVIATKSSDPVSGSAVAEGKVVIYTLGWTNTGKATGIVDSTDDLSKVLDDADVTAEPVSDTDTVTVTREGESLVVDGMIEPGQTATVTYQVTVKADGERGDNIMTNVLVPSWPCGENCPPENVIYNPELDDWKTVETSEAPVKAGTVLSYTLFFESKGEAPAVVDRVDDLSQVTDDADITVEPSSAQGLTATRDGDRIVINGEIPVGETYTVTYQATVRADGERGDDVATNYLLKPGEVPPPDGCVPTTDQRSDCTTTPIGELVTSKTVSASTDEVAEGTVLTYTLNFENPKKGPIVVNHVDILTDVLDDADVTAAPKASDDALTVSDITDGRFAITGELKGGAKATVTYQVTVKPEAQRGNNEANNFLVPDGTTPPEKCVPTEGQLPNCTATPMPKISVEKSADPVSGSSVQAGQEITYTLNFANDGSAEGKIDYVDNLAAVLDDAELTTAASSSSPALSVTSGKDGQIKITGALAAKEKATVSYTVTVKPDGKRGDNELRNVVAKTGTIDPKCGDDGVKCTEHHSGELDDWKTVDPASGTTVRSGEVVTYTLHFENTGKAALDISRDDVLSGVLDDADVTSAPQASSAALSVSEIANGRFTVTGSLEPGQHETVTYQATVRADGQRGDDRLGNFLVKPEEEPPTECVPAEGERADCTINHVSDVTVTKSSNPTSGAAVNVGQEVTYTVTFENRSMNKDAAPAAIDYTDHMVDVLDDAELVSAPKASNEKLSVTTTAETIRIVGAVPAGEKYTVTYSVKVKAYAEQGNHQLGNVVAITGEEPICAEGSELCTKHNVPKPPPGGSLPQTGGELSTVVVSTALVLLLAGGMLLVASRRRKAGAEHQDVTIDELI